MDEYKRLYELYQTKTDSELENISNPKNGYTAMAIKVASDILTYGRIGCEQTLEKQGGILSLPKQSLENEDKDVRHPQKSSWLVGIAIICGLIACAIIVSAILDLSKAAVSKEPTNNPIEGNVYEGAENFYGIVFYFYDRNTFAYSTSSGTNFYYGTYDTDGNAITLRIGSEIYYAVSLGGGNKIMINNSPLTKTTDEKLLSIYKTHFANSN